MARGANHGRTPPRTLAAHAAKQLARQHALAYAWLDSDGYIRAASPEFAALVPGPLVGRALTEAFDVLLGFEETLRAVTRGAQVPVRLERLQWSQPDAPLAYYDIELSALSGGVLVTVADVTAAAQVEQTLVQERNTLRLTRAELASANTALAQLSQLKSLFVAMAAHDMRSPLQGLYGFTDLLAYELPSGNVEAHELLTLMRAQTRRMERLLSDFLDVEQIDRGQLRIQKRACDLAALVSGVVAGLHALPLRNAARIAYVGTRDPLPVFTDPARVEQILYNLLDNAGKYTPAAGQITVDLVRADDGAIIQVTDTGPGMAPEQQVGLFELFYRTAAARASTVRGTGLGLFIVKTVAMALGGRVGVESVVGQGTTFSVWLPLAEAPA